MKKLIQLSLILSISASCYAAVTGTFRGKKYDRIETRTEILDEKNLQALGLTIWDSTLQEAQKKIGQTLIQEDGAAPPRDTAQVCYAGPSGVLLLNSPSTKSSREFPQIIQTIIFSHDKNIPERFANCTKSSAIDENLVFFSDLQMGMSQESVKKKWGEPGFVSPKVMIYKIRRIQKKYFTDDVSLYLEFNNKKLSFARMSRLAIR